MSKQTMKEYFVRVPRSTKVFTVFALILAGGVIGVGVWLDGSARISEEFIQSKEQASLISNELLDLSKDSILNLERITLLNSEFKYDEATQLIRVEFDKNEKIKEKANALSDDLARMAKSSVLIYSDETAQIALEAVSVQTDLLSNLIAYNDNLNELLGILEMQINGQEINIKDVEFLTGKINSLAQSVDELDKEFDELIGILDEKSK